MSKKEQKILTYMLGVPLAACAFGFGCRIASLIPEDCPDDVPLLAMSTMLLSIGLLLTLNAKTTDENGK